MVVGLCLIHVTVCLTIIRERRCGAMQHSRYQIGISLKASAQAKLTCDGWAAHPLKIFLLIYAVSLNLLRFLHHFLNQAPRLSAGRQDTP